MITKQRCYSLLQCALLEWVLEQILSVPFDDELLHNFSAKRPMSGEEQ